jgi:SAM-dependent MidA family methyltransferase
MQRQLSELEAF